MFSSKPSTEDWDFELKQEIRELNCSDKTSMKMGSFTSKMAASRVLLRVHSFDDCELQEGPHPEMCWFR